MLDFQKLDPFWNLWSKSNPDISSKMLHPARLNCNFERQIGHEIFVKTEKTEYLSNQLTYAQFNQKFILPIKFGTSEQIFIFFGFPKCFKFLEQLLLKSPYESFIRSSAFPFIIITFISRAKTLLIAYNMGKKSTFYRNLQIQ